MASFRDKALELAKRKANSMEEESLYRKLLLGFKKPSLSSDIDPLSQIVSRAQQLHRQYDPLFNIIREEGGYLYGRTRYNPGYLPIEDLQGNIVKYLKRHTEEQDPYNIYLQEERMTGGAGYSILRRESAEHPSNIGRIVEKARAVYNNPELAEADVLNALRNEAYGGVVKKLVKSPRGFYRKAAEELGLPSDFIAKQRRKTSTTEIKLPGRPTFENILPDELKLFKIGGGAEQVWNLAKAHPWKAAGIGGMFVAGIGITSSLLAKRTSQSMAYENRNKKENKHPYRSTRSVQSAGIFG